VKLIFSVISVISVSTISYSIYHFDSSNTLVHYTKYIYQLYLITINYAPIQEYISGEKNVDFGKEKLTLGNLKKEVKTDAAGRLCIEDNYSNYTFFEYSFQSKKYSCNG
jgi:hypothetical protein